MDGLGKAIGPVREAGPRKGGVLSAINFSEQAMQGGNGTYQKAVEEIHGRYGFDFVSMGLTAFSGSPLRWVYSAGATNNRHRRIALSPGHGIGGITIKSGKPMLFTDIDREIDPREYSSYPIVFAEDLQSFCALPLTAGSKVVAVLLCAYRSPKNIEDSRFNDVMADLDGSFCEFKVVTEDFLDFEAIAKESAALSEPGSALFHSEISRVIAAQENERKRISRELHDSIAQELFSVSFLIEKVKAGIGKDGPHETIAEMENAITHILDEIHNISVELRPSSLDHLGVLPALRSQALVFEKAYGARIDFADSQAGVRFDPAFETQVYRICQEAILNACKYSESDRITVEWEESSGWLHATIRDNGTGFDAAHPEIKGSGCGLSGMKERAHLIGATLTINSGSAGTTIVLLAPMGPEAMRKGSEEADDTNSAG